MEVLESPGPASLRRIEELVDLGAFITFWAATVLIGNADSYPANANNYYLYRDAKSGKFFWLPWGADAWSFETDIVGKRVPKSVWAWGHLCRRLWELPEIRESYRKEMRRLLTEVWNEKSILAELDQIRRLCQDDLPEKRREKALKTMVRFIETQRAALQVELDRPAPDWTEPRLSRRPPVGADQPPMHVEGSFSAEVAESFPIDTVGYFGRGAATLHFTVAGEVHKPFARSGAVAVIRKSLAEENCIRIVAADMDRGLSWHLWFRMDPYRTPLTPGILDIGYWTVWAPLFQGDPFSPKAQQRAGPQNTGILELTQVSTNLGGTISGKFKINTTAFEEKKNR